MCLKTLCEVFSFFPFFLNLKNTLARGVLHSPLYGLVKRQFLITTLLHSLVQSAVVTNNALCLMSGLVSGI